MFIFNNIANCAFIRSKFYIYNISIFIRTLYILSLAQYIFDIQIFVLILLDNIKFS